MPLIALEELGLYGRRVFDNVERGNGTTLKLGTRHIKSACLVRGFAAVIGRKAVYKGLDTLLTYRQSFTGFWTMWKSNGTISF